MRPQGVFFQRNTYIFVVLLAVLLGLSCTLDEGREESPLTKGVLDYRYTLLERPLGHPIFAKNGWKARPISELSLTPLPKPGEVNPVESQRTNLLENKHKDAYSQAFDLLKAMGTESDLKHAVVTVTGADVYEEQLKGPLCDDSIPLKVIADIDNATKHHRTWQYSLFYQFAQSVLPWERIKEIEGNTLEELDSRFPDVTMEHINATNKLREALIDDDSAAYDALTAIAGAPRTAVQALTNRQTQSTSPLASLGDPEPRELGDLAGQLPVFFLGSKEWVFYYGANDGEAPHIRRYSEDLSDAGKTRADVFNLIYPLFEDDLRLKARFAGTSTNCGASGIGEVLLVVGNSHRKDLNGDDHLFRRAKEYATQNRTSSGHTIMAIALAVQPAGQTVGKAENGGVEPSDEKKKFIHPDYFTFQPRHVQELFKAIQQCREDSAARRKQS